MKWRVVENILIAWFLTLPATFLVAWSLMHLLQAFHIASRLHSL